VFLASEECNKISADEGEVFCWGWNKYGQVGYPSALFSILVKRKKRKEIATVSDTLVCPCSSASATRWTGMYLAVFQWTRTNH
jgi:alpha-tubulin suppressor-like RCC1 family protein